MKREVITTTGAPQAIGPYSQAIRVGDWIFVAGQGGLHPESGAIVEGGISAETRRALENIKAILEAGGSSMAQVVKTTVFLVDIGEFGAMNEVYAQFFPADPPARTTVAVAQLPKGIRVEIEAIAMVR